MSIENGPRVAFQLSPGATLQWHVDNAPNGLMALPLWLVWSRLAVEHATIAEAARESDRVIDAVALALQNPGSTIEITLIRTTRDRRKEPLSSTHL
jgi:hypothetical protein